MRVTDNQVLHALSWARNYGDIESWERIGKRNAKWLVRFAFDGEISSEYGGKVTDIRAFMQFLGPRAIDIVPHEMVLGNRDVLLLCYGLAIGGWREEPRSTYRDCWENDEPHPSEAARRDQRSRKS